MKPTIVFFVIIYGIFSFIDYIHTNDSFAIHKNNNFNIIISIPLAIIFFLIFKRKK